jgi:hypothetical protein
MDLPRGLKVLRSCHSIVRDYAMGERRGLPRGHPSTTCLVSAMRRGIELPDARVNYLERITRREAYEQALVANQPT